MLQIGGVHSRSRENFRENQGQCRKAPDITPKEETSMNNKSKALLLVLCAVALVAATVFGTLAYLTDTESATNTFTVGQVGLTLDEAPVGEDGIAVEGDRVKANSYDLMPGHTYDKDPMVTMDAGSEAAYVRMMVKVNMTQLQKAFPKEKFADFYVGDIFLLQNLCLDKDGSNTWNDDIWEYFTYHADTQTYEFRYKPNNGIVPKGTTVLDPLFTKITVPGLINNAQLAELDKTEIVITAHAIQADGFDNADAAWAAFATQQTANPNA